MTTIAIPITAMTRVGHELATPVAGTPDMGIPSNDGLVVVCIENPTGADLTATFVPTATYAGIALSNVVVTIGAGQTIWVGPWPPALFNEDDGSVSVSAASGLLLNGLRI